MVLRSKTVDLLQTGPLAKEVERNSRLNLEELENANTLLKSYPRRMVLELTSSCNIKCIMCGRDEAEFGSTFFNMAYLKKLQPLLERTEEVTLFGWGEPTVHPQFVEILEYVNRFPVRKYFVTNGTKLGQLREAIFENAVDIMAVSLDGASSETNDRIRVGSNFDDIISSLKAIVDEKRRRGLNYPYINFVFTIMKSNLHELPEMVRLTHRLGLEELKAVYLTVFGEDLLEESLWGCAEDVKHIFEEATELAETLGIKLKLPYIQGDDIAGEKFHKGCFVGWRDFFLGSDGYVRPCQSTTMKLFSFDKYDSFEEMWNSKEFEAFRTVVNSPETMPEECRRCYQSSHANWNMKSSFIQVGQSFSPIWERTKKIRTTKKEG